MPLRWIICGTSGQSVLQLYRHERLYSTHSSLLFCCTFTHGVAVAYDWMWLSLNASSSRSAHGCDADRPRELDLLKSRNFCFLCTLMSTMNNSANFAAFITSGAGMAAMTLAGGDDFAACLRNNTTRSYLRRIPFTLAMLPLQSYTFLALSRRANVLRFWALTDCN